MDRVCKIKEGQGDKGIDVLFLPVGYLSLVKAPGEHDLLYEHYEVKRGSFFF